MTVTFPEGFIDFTHRLKDTFSMETENPGLYWDATVLLTTETRLQFMVAYGEFDAFVFWAKTVFGRGIYIYITSDEDMHHGIGKQGPKGTQILDPRG